MIIKIWLNGYSVICYCHVALGVEIADTQIFICMDRFDELVPTIDVSKKSRI